MGVYKCINIWFSYVGLKPVSEYSLNFLTHHYRVPDVPVVA